MINKTRLIFVTISALCLLPGLVFADGKLSLRLQGGWTCLSAGDINSGTQALFDWRKADWVASAGGYKPVHKGFEIGGEIIFELTPRLGIGIGGGYLKISRYSQSRLYDPEEIASYETLGVEPTLSAVPIQAGVHLTVPLNAKFNLHADIGASYYFKARYSYEWRSIYWWIDVLSGYIQITTNAEKKNTPIGFQGGISLEYELRHNIFLYLDARGRYARFRGLKGSSVIESSFVTPSSEQGILYYESAPMLWDAPRVIMVQSDPPNGPGGEPRQAVIDFSGVSLQFGIRIRL